MSPPQQLSPEGSVQSGSPVAAPVTANPRKRIRTACTRCKNRKQKCDDELPVCSSCRRAGAECDKANVTLETVPGAYANALEEEVAMLENLLAERGISRADIDQRFEQLGAGRSRTPRPVAQSPKVTRSTRDAGDARPTAPNADPRQGHRFGTRKRADEDVDFFSVGSHEAPAYIGPSAGLSLAMNLGEIVQATVWRRAVPEVNQLPADSPRELRGKTRPSERRPMMMEELALLRCKEPPSDELGSRLVSTYFSYLHPLYPFLDSSEIWDLHSRRADLTPTSVGNPDTNQRYSVFKLYMVYAIGATCLYLAEKSFSVPPESYYALALQHIVPVHRTGTIDNIEAMALLAIHHLRSASGHGLWYIVGLAMRSCVGFGLHRGGYEHGLSPSQIQRRRRLFWSVYSLERTIAISLGRPLSISDRHIDVDLPDPELPLTGTPLAVPSLDGPSPTPLPSESDGGIRIAVFLFQIRRIESHIHHSIYRTDRSLLERRPKMDKHRQNLDDWRDSLIAAIPPNSPHIDYPLMHYHRALCLLIRPFLTLLAPSDTYYRLCLQSAGKICQTLKKMHQNMGFMHSFASVQILFVAGVTLVHGLWTHGNETWSISLADDIRACSMVLFVMSDRAPWVEKYRDAFEVLVEAAMEKLRQEDSLARGISNATGSGAIGSGASWSSGERDTRRSEYLNHRDPYTGSPTPYGSGQAHLCDVPNFPSFDWPHDSEIWRTVMELANWIDPDQESPPLEMPTPEN